MPDSCMTAGSKPIYVSRIHTQNLNIPSRVSLNGSFGDQVKQHLESKLKQHPKEVKPILKVTKVFWWALSAWASDVHRLYHPIRISRTTWLQQFIFFCLLPCVSVQSSQSNIDACPMLFIPKYTAYASMNAYCQDIWIVYITTWLRLVQFSDDVVITSNKYQPMHPVL